MECPHSKSLEERYLLLLLLTYLKCVCSDNPLTCCDADQVNTLNTNMKLPRQVNNLCWFLEYCLACATQQRFSCGDV